MKSASLVKKGDHENIPAGIDLGFDTSELTIINRMAVEKATHEIKYKLETTTREIMEVGEKLTKIKELIGHGNFLSWIDSQFGMSERSAQNFMAVNDKFKNATVADLENIGAKALYLLAAPSTPQEARDEAIAQAASGKPVTHKGAKTILEKHAPKNRNTREKAPTVPTAPTPAPETPPAEAPKFRHPWDKTPTPAEPAFKVDYSFDDLPRGYGKTTYPEGQEGDYLRAVLAGAVEILNKTYEAGKALGFDKITMARRLENAAQDIVEIQAALMQAKNKK